MFDLLSNLEVTYVTEPLSVPESRRDWLPLLNAEGEFLSLRESEREIIQRAVIYYRGQMSNAARALKIGRSTLYRKMDEYELKIPQRG